MLVIIREGTEPSPKVEKLLQSLDLSSDRILFVGKSGKKFLASQSENSIILRASARSIFTYFLLMAIKSPNDIRDGIIRRLLRRNVDRALINSGFFSTISDVLYNFFGTSSVSTYLMSYLTKVKDPKLFVIDEFISLKTLNLKKLKKRGPIIYVSQDIAYTRYGFADNIVSQFFIQINHLQIEMDHRPMVPNIRCSSCGAVIGNKFVQFNMLVECGSTKLEAFQALDIDQYCCRKDLVNPIVLSTKIDQISSSTKKTPESNRDTRLSGQKVLIELPNSSLDRLTSSMGKEIAIIPLSHSDNINTNYLADLKRELVISNVEDIPFTVKEVDPDAVFGSEIIVNTSKISAGSGFRIDRIHKTYKAD